MILPILGWIVFMVVFVAPILYVWLMIIEDVHKLRKSKKKVNEKS